MHQIVYGRIETARLCRFYARFGIDCFIAVSPQTGVFAAYNLLRLFRSQMVWGRAKTGGKFAGKKDKNNEHK